MTTGMRHGEVGALRWSRVDLDLGVVDVRRSYGPSRVPALTEAQTHEQAQGCGDDDSEEVDAELDDRGQRFPAVAVQWVTSRASFVKAAVQPASAPPRPCAGYGPSLRVIRVLAPWSWNSTRSTLGSGIPNSGIGSDRSTSSSGST